MFPRPPIELSELAFVNLTHFPFSPWSLRVFGLAVRLASSILFGLFILSLMPPDKKHSKYLATFASGLFFLSPWVNLISTFYPIQNLLLLASLTLLTALKSEKTKLVLSIGAVIVTILLLNKDLGPNYSFLTQLKPTNLAVTINERQKIDFLAVNKKFILPRLFRSFTYNKPFLAFNKILSQTVSFFDFEQVASPLQSYSITRLSGISPKGNLPLLIIWEIPLIILGGYLVISGKTKVEGKKLLGLFFVFLLPFLAFEKKLLAQTAFLEIIPLLILETTAWFFLFKSKNAFVLTGGLLVVLGLGLISYYRMFFTEPLKYQTPQPYLFREIAVWLRNNYTPDKNYVITTRFGPTDMMMPFYMGSSPKNVIYGSFDYKSADAKENTHYIGLPGEFVGRGRDLEAKAVSVGFANFQKITGEDEPVTDYGKDIWITPPKD